MQMTIDVNIGEVIMRDYMKFSMYSETFYKTNEGKWFQLDCSVYIEEESNKIFHYEYVQHMDDNGDYGDEGWVNPEDSGLYATHYINVRHNVGNVELYLQAMSSDLDRFCIAL